MNHETGPAILVDCGGEEEFRAHRALLTKRLKGLVSWDGPRQSLGNHAGTGKRSSFIGYFDGTVTSELDLRICVDIIRRDGILGSCLVGRRSLFGDSASVLIDMGHPGALT